MLYCIYVILKSHILLLFSPLLNAFMSPLLQDITFFSFLMPINDDVSKPVKLIENKTLKHFRPNLLNQQSVCSLCIASTHMLQMMTN